MASEMMIAATSADQKEDPTTTTTKAGGKKQAWKKPSNGAVIEVMGTAESWPALSESTRFSPKLSDSPKPPLTDGSALLPLVARVIPSSGQNQVTMNNTNPNIPPSNHVIPTRQNSMKRSGGSSSGTNNNVNGAFSQPPPSHHSPVTDMPPGNLGKKAVAELSPKDHNTHKESGQRGAGSQSRSGNDYIQRSDSFKKGNGGPQNYGGRGNQDRGNHEWNSQRSFNGRDRASPRGFRPPTHAPTPLFNPPPVAIRPYPMVYPEVPSQVFLYSAPHESFRGVPLVSPVSPHGMYYAGPDPQLIATIVHQVDYYFSNENLVKDIYLRNNMDDQGWVPVQLIASFKKMSILTENIQLILAAVCHSSVVEVEGDKIRRRGDWGRWIMPAAQSPISSPHGQGSFNHEMLVANTQSLSLEEKRHVDTSFRSYSGDFSQSQAPPQAGTVPVRSPSE